MIIHSIINILSIGERGDFSIEGLGVIGLLCVPLGVGSSCSSLILIGN